MSDPSWDWFNEWTDEPGICCYLYKASMWETTASRMSDSFKLCFSDAARLLIDCLMKSLTFLMFSVWAVLKAFSTSVC